MTSELFEELLYEDEGAGLDFKRDQYPFAGATDEQKGELIKDILSLANSWRRTTAYILVGVEEVQGAKSIVVGVSNHLNEAHLQQLVNSKTNRPVEFAYQGIVYQRMQVGVISVPVQERPLYVKSDYGKLKSNTVYIRRGSSTAVANPDEVSRMGADTGTNVLTPIVDLQFAVKWTQLKL